MRLLTIARSRMDRSLNSTTFLSSCRRGSLGFGRPKSISRKIRGNKLRCREEARPAAPSKLYGRLHKPPGRAEWPRAHPKPCGNQGRPKPPRREPGEEA